MYEPLKYYPGSIDPRDVEQEASLLLLAGKTPHRGLIAKRMKREAGLLFSTDDDWSSGLSPVAYHDYNPPKPYLETVDTLVHWALDQEEDIQEVMWNFLTEPSEEALKVTLKELSTRGVHLHQPKKSPRVKGSYSTILMKYLSEQKKITKDQAIELAYQYGFSKTSARPEALVRQTLRNFLRAGKITMTELNGEEVYAI